MVGRWAIVVSTVTFVFAGCLDDAPETNQQLLEGAGTLDAAQQVHKLVFTGHIVSDETAELSHTRQTEELLWPVQQVGWTIDIPEGVIDFEVAVEWNKGNAIQIDIHSHNHTTEQCCIRHQTDYSVERPHCVRVPSNHIHPGEYEPMIRTSGARQVDFTLTILTIGAEATEVVRRHGHDRANEVVEGRTDSFPSTEDCVLWPRFQV